MPKLTYEVIRVPKRKHVWSVILFIICISIVMSGCGKADSSNQPEGREEAVMGDGKQDGKKKRPEDGQSGIVAGSIESSLKVLEPQNEKGILFRYELKNQTEKEKIFEFSTSQKFDYVIKDKNGKIVYQYSKDHMFMQVLTSLKLKPADTFKQDILVKDLESGTYDLEVWLTPKGETEDYRQKITFNWN
jgi:Intracellular proteinase inhibitor